jgi:hypothetical protein
MMNQSANNPNENPNGNQSGQGNEKPKRRFPSSALLMSLAAVVLIAATTLLIPANPNQPEPTQAAEPADPAVGDNENIRVAEGCELLQTLSFTRCEHTLTRRVAAPTELYGKSLAEVQALYDAWAISEFTAREIKMSQRPDLHCPDHMVLLPNEGGVLCVFQNKYGDALALVSELQTELAALPSSMQEEVRQGIGFPSLQELEQWLENAES